MSAQSVTTAGRAAAEARMLDSCEVGRYGEGPMDSEGQPTTVLLVAHYEGLCRVGSSSNAVSDSDAGGQSFASQSFILSVPVASGGSISTDDMVTITAVDEVSGNPAMIDRVFRVTGLASVSQATAARFSLELTS